MSIYTSEMHHMANWVIRQ